MTVVACYFFPVQPVVLIVASRSPLVSAHFSISDWRDLMKFKKTILILWLTSLGQLGSSEVWRRVRPPYSGRGPSRVSLVPVRLALVFVDPRTCGHRVGATTLV